MECFENYCSEDLVCRGCWLSECCKIRKNENERKALDRIKSPVLVFLHYNGGALTKLKMGYNKMLEDFAESE